MLVILYAWHWKRGLGVTVRRGLVGEQSRPEGVGWEEVVEVEREEVMPAAMVVVAEAVDVEEVVEVSFVFLFQAFFV